jgi:hypothetical protein
MPVSLKKLAANTSTASFAVGDDTVHVTYSPYLLTEELFAKMDAFYNGDGEEEKNDGKQALKKYALLNSIIVQLVREWDLLEDDEETMIPLTERDLPRVPLFLRMETLGAIMNDFRPEVLAGPTPTQNSENSGDTSPQTA